MASERTRKKDKITRPGEQTPAEDVSGAERDATGRFLPGHTPNPGGMTKSMREARASFLEHLPEAREKVLAMMRGGEPEDQRWALDVIITRSLGKPVKASELPGVSEPPTDPGAASDSGGMLAELRAVLAREIAKAKHRAAEEDPGPGHIETLAALTRAVTDLDAAEVKARTASETSRMGLDELLAAVLAEVGREKMLAFIAKMPETAPGAPPGPVEGGGA